MNALLRFWHRVRLRVKGRKAVINSLKAMSKPIDWLSRDAVEGYITSLNGENDRGVIILQASTLELLLDGAIKRMWPHLNSDEKDRLFGYNGPIGSFSNKIKIANGMGLISREIASKFDLIREMRNACAHSREPVSFQAEPIFDAVICLVHDMRIFIPKQDDRVSIRNAFLVMGMLIMATVLKGGVNAGHDALMQVLSELQPSPEKPARESQ